MLFRDVELRFYDWVTKNNQSDTIRQVAHLLVPRKKLVLGRKEDIYNTYQLPEDYFNIYNLHVKDTDGTCTDEVRTEEVKTENLQQILSDEFSKPSFEFRETVS